MKKMAICIPTYNRKEVIEDILHKINSFFKTDEVDVYIFDSSEEFIEYKYCNEPSLLNIYYKKLDTTVHSNEKVYIIYQTKEIIEGYEYIWILPDYMFYSQSVIKNIMEALDEKNDFILINYWNNEKMEAHWCYDINYVFSKYAALLTQFGTIIVRSKIFSQKLLIESISDKYLRDDRINFSQIGLYFEIMSKCNKLRIKVIECEKKDYYKSSAKKLYISKENLSKKKTTSWETAFHVWAVCWPETIKALPNIYKNKWTVVRSEVERANILNERFLISQRSIGATKIKIVLKNAIRWKYISMTPFIKTVFICLMPKKYAEWCTYNRSIFVKKKVENNLKQLKKIATKKEIYIYGAGKKADEYIRILEANCIPIKSLVVTDAQMFVESAYGYRVIGIEELKEINSEYVVILALNEENKYAVKRLLNDYNMTGYLYEDKINVW